MCLFSKISSAKYANPYAVLDQSSTRVEKLLFKNYICEHGIWEMLHTDQGCQFESDLVKTCTLYASYCVQYDCLNELFNWTIIDLLNK